MLFWGSEGERGRVWHGSERVTHGVHDVAVEGDASQASRQGSRGGVGVSAKLRGDRSVSGMGHTSWGAVVEKDGVGVHARPRHGGRCTAAGVYGEAGVRVRSSPFCRVWREVK